MRPDSWVKGNSESGGASSANLTLSWLDGEGRVHGGLWFDSLKVDLVRVLSLVKGVVFDNLHVEVVFLARAGLRVSGMSQLWSLLVVHMPVYGHRLDTSVLHVEYLFD